MKKILIGLFLLISGYAWASAPSSSFTYVSGQAINPTQVQTNENNIYTYLQSGVDTYKVSSITQAAISSNAGILYSQLNLSGGIVPTDINTVTTTNVYTFQNITIPSTGQFIYGTEHQGDILYDNGTSFVRLTPGTAGYFLVTNGTSSNPSWDTFWGTPSTSLVSGTTYGPAGTDGLFIVQVAGNGSGGTSVQILSDTSNPPTTSKITCTAAINVDVYCAYPIVIGKYYKWVGVNENVHNAEFWPTN